MQNPTDSVKFIQLYDRQSGFDVCLRFYCWNPQENDIECICNFKWAHLPETELILWMTEIRIDKRPTANEVLNSEIFKKWKEELKQ